MCVSLCVTLVILYVTISLPCLLPNPFCKGNLWNGNSAPGVKPHLKGVYCKNKEFAHWDLRLPTSQWQLTAYLSTVNQYFSCLQQRVCSFLAKLVNSVNPIGWDSSPKLKFHVSLTMHSLFLLSMLVNIREINSTIEKLSSIFVRTFCNAINLWARKRVSHLVFVSKGMEIAEFV